MPAFTPEEIAALYDPFPVEAHKIREGSRTRNGKIQWFVYLDRPAIQKRLDVLFPGEWSSTLSDFHRGADYVTVTTTITIRGVARAFNGGASPKWADDEIDQDKEKGAATDSFRRAASMWGLGLYCYEGYTIYTEGYEKGQYEKRDAVTADAWAQFERKYHAQFNGGEIAPPSTAAPAIVKKPEQPGPKPVAKSNAREKLANDGAHRLATDDKAAKSAAFGQWFEKHKDVLPNSQKTVLIDALGITFPSDFDGTVDDMLGKLHEHYKTGEAS